jgi:hypothetical protein
MERPGEAAPAETGSAPSGRLGLAGRLGSRRPRGESLPTPTSYPPPAKTKRRHSTCALGPPAPRAPQGRAGIAASTVLREPTRHRALAPPGKAKLTIGAAGTLDRPGDDGYSLGPSPHRTERDLVSVEPSLFLSCVYPMLIYSRALGACLNHSSLFKVNVESGIPPSLVGRGRLSWPAPSERPRRAPGIFCVVWRFSGEAR